MALGELTPGDRRVLRRLLAFLALAAACLLAWRAG
jgi:hypothetical protein